MDSGGLEAAYHFGMVQEENLEETRELAEREAERRNPKFVFVGLKSDSKWLDSAKSFGYDTYCGDIRKYKPPSWCDRVFYISPANSLLFMDGGIDYAYSKVMFPGIDTKIREYIQKNGCTSFLGRKYLPIGRMLCAKYDSKNYLLSAPTMLLPQNVSGTMNARYAMNAIMKWVKMGDEITEKSLIVVPALCCGVGGMSHDQSFMQVQSAITNPEENDIDKITKEQPNFYMNTEWKDIPPEQIV